MTHWREAIQERLVEGGYPVKRGVGRDEYSISRKDDERTMFEIWRLLKGLHFAFAFLIFGLWLLVVFNVLGDGVPGILICYFIAAIVAGMLAPYLIWLKQTPPKNS